MTANANSLVQTPAKSPHGAAGIRPDGTKGGSGASAGETAAAFQSVLQGMTHGKRPAETIDQKGRGQGDPRQAQDETEAGPEQKQAGETVVTPAGSAAFSTSNLVSALRDASRTAMARFAGPEGEEKPAEENGKTVPPGLPAPQGLGVQAATALASGTLLPPKAGQPEVNSHQTQPAAARQTASDGTVQNAAVKDGQGRTGTASLFAQFGVEPEPVADPLAGGGGRRSLLPEEAAGTVKVLRQETHFAPNMRLSPAQQVGEQVATALKSLASDQGVQSQGGLTHRAEGPVLKTLDIQLTPHELGTVRVSLRMVGESVEVTLQASQPQTAELLKQDRQLLDQMLKATGVKADAVTIQTADDRVSVQAGNSAGGNASMNQNNSGNGGFGDGQPQYAGSGQSGNRDGHGGQGPHDDVFPESQAARGEGHEDDTGSRLSDGIYL
ncbi:MAG: flagellar hook-length control protein FliK [Roseibium sp.]